MTEVAFNNETHCYKCSDMLGDEDKVTAISLENIEVLRIINVLNFVFILVNLKFQ